jgi:hypothetical protein
MAGLLGGRSTGSVLIVGCCCRAAAATYAQQVQASIAAVQREYGLPIPGSSRNVFAWQKRPDVAAIAAIMCHYIKEWDHHQVSCCMLASCGDFLLLRFHCCT